MSDTNKTLTPINWPEALKGLEQAQVLAMVQQFGIESFVPHCVVCRQAVPPKRASSRSKDTCSKECHAVLRAYRKHMIASRYCVSCYHPSTPAERKEFISWRKARGDRRPTGGRPWKEIKLAEALSEAIGLLNPETGTLVSSKIAQFKKLIDATDGKQSTLAPSGKPAQGE